MTESRLESLELKLMELEHTVQQLNDVILKQYQDIDALRRSHAQLQDKLANGSDAVASQANPAALDDELPPHY